MIFKNFILIFKFFYIFTNYSFAKDLSGNAIDCKKVEELNIGDDHVEATIQFLTKNKVKFAYADFLRDNQGIKKFLALVQDKIFNYKVLEKKIVITVGDSKNIYDRKGLWKNRFEDKGEIRINRETLNSKYLKNCKLVDANNPKLFHKYSDYKETLKQILQKEKKESESKNKL